MNRQEVIQIQTDEIMDEFDFEFVRKIFEENEWTYHGKFDTPSLGDLRKMARYVIKFAAEDRYCSSGRFTAICIEDSDEKWLRLELMFTPAKWSIDEGGTYE
jgi:hypothetical protein